MILACPSCDGRYDVTGYPIGQQFRCRCGTIVTLEAPSRQVGMLSCPHCGGPVAPSSSQCAHCQHELLIKACPRCLSRVYHGHKHCPDCGTELSVVAIAEKHTERMCPRCEQQLGPRLVQDVVIDECMGCRGLFLDQTAIQRIITERQQARAEALLGALPRPENLALHRPGHKLYVKCPICSQVMNRKLFAAGAGVIIDVCRAHGTFFDAGELPRTIEFVMNGGLEQAKRKELERMREQASSERQSAIYAAINASRTSSSAHTSWSFSGHSASGDAFVDLLYSLFR